MLVEDVNELFLIDAMHLTGEVQRFSRGRQASGAASAATAAEALGELLRTLGLHHYALCSQSLASRLRDPDRQVELDSGRAGAATLAARLNDLIEELRHKKLNDDGGDFAAMWMAEYAGEAPELAAAVSTPEELPQSTAAQPTVEVETESELQAARLAQMIAASEEAASGVRSESEFVGFETPQPEEEFAAAEFPIDMAPDATEASEERFEGGRHGDNLPLPQELGIFGFENPQRLATLAQARRLHARLAQLGSGMERSTLDAQVRQLLRGLRIDAGQIGSVALESPVSGSLLALGALGVAFDHLAVCRAEPRTVDAQLVCIDVEVAASSATGMWAASKAIGQCGGRIDASPLGWRLTVPADTDRLSVVVLDTESGPLAVHALQFEAWVADDGLTSTAPGAAPVAASSSGSLALRLGALEVEIPLVSSTPSFSGSPATSAVWRFELPTSEHWPCPAGWDALVADESGRIMPLLVPQTDRSGEQYQLTDFA